MGSPQTYEDVAETTTETTETAPVQTQATAEEKLVVAIQALEVASAALAQIKGN